VKGRGTFALACALVAAALFGPAPAGAQPCQLALVLALDASSSVDAREYRLQTEGIAAAFADPDVAGAILAAGGVLVTAFEWSGREQHVPYAPWTWLDSPTAIDAFAARIGAASRRFVEFPTALGHALGYSAIRLSRAPMACRRQVVDVSGDGVNNDGFGPGSAYRAHDFDRVTVNGLVVKGADPDPEAYYRTQVMHGPGAFVEIAADYGDYARAMRRKLLREILGGAIASAE